MQPDAHRTVAAVGLDLALEAELQTAVLGKPNQLEAIAANMEKRPARFRDPG